MPLAAFCFLAVITVWPPACMCGSAGIVRAGCPFLLCADSPPLHVPLCVDSSRLYVEEEAPCVVVSMHAPPEQDPIEAAGGHEVMESELTPYPLDAGLLLSYGWAALAASTFTARLLEVASIPAVPDRLARGWEPSAAAAQPWTSLCWEAHCESQDTGYRRGP